MPSAVMGESYTMGNTSSGHRYADVLQDWGPLPTLLSSNTQNVNGFLQPLCYDGSVLKTEAGPKSALLVPAGRNISKPLTTLQGSASGLAQTRTSESTTMDSAEKEETKQAEADAEQKGFVDGARVEYYSTSYREWIPAIIGDIRPNGCLKLFHDDGSVLKREADPKSVRSACEKAEKGYDKQEQFNSSFSERKLGMCSQAASGIKEALGSKEAYDQQMKLLHSLSEKYSAQLKIHRGLSEGMASDQQLEFSHLEFRRSLSEVLGPDMTNLMQSSDELMRQMNFRHGLSSMYDHQLTLDRSLSAGMGSQAM